jgi:hypothetical protein
LIGASFLRHVWSHQPDGYKFVVYRKGRFWREACISPEDTADFSLVLPTSGDLYFTPNVFSEPLRQRQYCLPSRVMYQDLDEVSPGECPLYPDLSWETSLGRYQGLWILESPIEPAEFAALNRGLNRACGADPGTWNLTRVLRVPGSYNGKRRCRVSAAVGAEGVVAA